MKGRCIYCGWRCKYGALTCSACRYLRTAEKASEAALDRLLKAYYEGETVGSRVS